MCWFQGEERLKNLNKLCVERWKKLNPDWQVNVLSDDTISQYVPEYFDILDNSPKNSKGNYIRRGPACSDLLRILLLSKYGGVWVDASVYPMIPLSDFYDKIVNETGFFAYRFIPRGGYQGMKSAETCSWFLCANKPKHYLIEKWKSLFTNRFKTKKDWPYFTFHQTITDLYDTDSKIKKIIDDMIQIDQKIPHSAVSNWEKRKDSYVYKRPNYESLTRNKKQ